MLAPFAVFLVWVGPYGQQYRVYSSAVFGYTGWRDTSTTVKVPAPLFTEPGSLSVFLMDTGTASPNLVFPPPSFDEPSPTTSFPSDRPFSLPGDPPSVARAASHIRKTAQGRGRQRQNVHGQEYSLSHRQTTTINALPDDVLLKIFCFYKDYKETTVTTRWYPVWDWHLLVHICRRWRQIVFASPLRLDLKILCTSRTPVRQSLGIWPALPIHVYYDHWPLYVQAVQGPHNDNVSDQDNLIAALEHPDRVFSVRLMGSQLKKIATVMQVPFPVLTDLQIASGDWDWNAPVLPAEFLGGSAPCLQSIVLDGISFPALPTLLLSTSDLVALCVRNITPPSYISPETMAVALAALPSLKTFIVDFRLDCPRPDLIHPPPISRTVLPVLSGIEFHGACEYLEDLVSRIDAPQLDGIAIEYLNHVVDFQVGRLSRFINRSVGPKISLFKYAEVTLYKDRVAFSPYIRADRPSLGQHYASTCILCEGTDGQVSQIAQVLSPFSATLSNVVHLTLEVYFDGEEFPRLEDTDDVEWLRLLHQFPAVQTLLVHEELAENLALALEDIAAEMVADVLPSLNFICLDGQPASAVENFVAARRLSDHPVTVIDTEMELEERRKS